MYFLTLTLLSWLTPPPLAWPCLSIPKRTSWSSTPECPVGFPGLQKPTPKPMDGDCEAANKKALLPHLKPGAETHFIPVLLNPFFLLFSFLPWLCPNCFLPIARYTNSDRKHEPKATPGTGQPCGSLQASPGHEAVILFMGTNGAWMVWQS